MERQTLSASANSDFCCTSGPCTLASYPLKDEKKLLSSSLGSGRPRKHSWSRPVRRLNARVNVEHLTPHTVEGNAHICFSKDKSWFLGNVIEQGKGPVSGSIYKLSGKIVNIDEHFNDQKMSVNDIFQLATLYDDVSIHELENGSSPMGDIQGPPILNPHLVKMSKSDGESSSNSPDSHTLSSFSSGSDYLDSDLVKAAIERLNSDDTQVLSPLSYSRSSSISVASPASPSGFDIQSDIDSSSRKYNIAITDFETGMTYNMEGIKSGSNSECTIIGEDRNSQISFKSKKCFKGNSADVMISRHLGPSFVDKNMSVFVGDIRLKYTDPVCKPHNKTVSQWCN